MLPLIKDDCNDCKPSYLDDSQNANLLSHPTTFIISYSPFILTFLLVSTLVSKKLIPYLTSSSPASTSFSNNARSITDIWRLFRFKKNAQELASLTCSITLGLSAVLIELILCEVSNTLNPRAREVTLRVCLRGLVGLVVLAVPAVEIYSVLGMFRYLKGDTTTKGRGGVTLRVVFTTMILGIWLVVFEYLPFLNILPKTLRDDKKSNQGLLQGSLKRIGIIGIALMAGLAGFAAVSSIWQTLIVKRKTVKETDISRKEAGLISVKSMLETKQSRLRALERRLSQSSASKQGLLGRVTSTFKTDTEGQERKCLEMEISGLETMEVTLESSLADLQMTFDQQVRSRTIMGKCLQAFNFAFAVFCIYRIITVSISTLRRITSSTTSRTSTDPISSMLALLSTHISPNLNTPSWSRQISFFMSGIILLLSFSAVLQTFRLFQRLLPSSILLSRSTTSLPLVVAQVAATYVISSAMMLRGSLPPELRGRVQGALTGGTDNNGDDGGLDMRGAEAWFEAWFLAVAGIVTASLGIWKRFKWSEMDGWDDDYHGGFNDVNDVIVGKRKTDVELGEKMC